MVREEIIPPEEFALFLAMREKAMAGAVVHFRVDRRTGELIAHEEVLHKASSYISEPQHVNGSSRERTK